MGLRGADSRISHLIPCLMLQHAHLQPTETFLVTTFSRYNSCRRQNLWLVARLNSHSYSLPPL